MALILHPLTSSFLTTNKPHLHLHLLLHQSIHHKPPIKSQQDSSTEETISGPSSNNKPGTSSQGLGFGASAAAASDKKKQPKGKRASIIRREPAEKPSFATPQQVVQSEELKKIDSAFLLTWLVLGVVILVQGIALASAGFLPEEWDKLFVKYLYPSFTPTVFLFVAGTTGYGVLKYLQNENANKQN